jgi:hypothetical protein
MHHQSLGSNIYYAALRARLERGLLFGRRRRDKRDQ